jgi:hypothetical protein
MIIPLSFTNNLLVIGNLITRVARGHHPDERLKFNAQPLPDPQTGALIVPALVLADIFEPSTVQALSGWVRDWEPSLELMAFTEDSRIYEPDGTLYVVCISGESIVTVRHKPRPVRAGDAFVLPQGVAVELEGSMTVLAFRHDGAVPVHFRERFIQTWGIDYRPVTTPVAVGITTVLPAIGSTFRIGYDLIVLDDAGHLCEPIGDPQLVFALQGSPQVIMNSGETATLGETALALIMPMQSFQIVGEGVVGRIVLETELAFETRRLAEWTKAPAAVSPEYKSTSSSE